MKKCYITLLAALFSVVAIAQHSLRQMATPCRPSANILSENRTLAKHFKTNLKSLKITLPGKFGAKKVFKAEDSEIITEQPEGTLHKNWSQYAKGYFPIWGYIMGGIQDGTLYDFVEADDGAVYLKNPISGIVTDSWIKGYKTVGDTIAFDFPQKVYTVYDDYDNPIDCSVWRMMFTTMEEDGQMVQTFIPDPDTQTIKFTLRNDTLKMITNDVMLLGLGTADKGEWVGYGDYVSVANKVNDPTYAPSNPESAEQGIMRYALSEDYYDYVFTNIAVEGNEIYLSGLDPALPDAWVKGKIEGDKAVFEGKTYLGVDEGNAMHAYFSPLGKETKSYEFDDGDVMDIDSLFFEDQLVFSYDAEKKLLTTDGGMVINKGKGEFVNDIYSYFDLRISPWSDKPGIPEAPEIMEFYPYDETEDWGAIQIALPRNDVDYNYLNVNKLYYRLYFDNNPFIFTTDVYPEFEKDIIDIPFSYIGNDIVGGDDVRAIYLHSGNFKKLGVQEVFIDPDDNDKRYESKIVWVNADGTFDTDGMKNAIADKGSTVKSVSYTDICGRKVDKPVHGLFIKTVSMADGTVRTSKVAIK